MVSRKKNYGNVFVVLQITCPKQPLTRSFDGIERYSISAKCGARPFTVFLVVFFFSFLVDMCAVLLILSLTFALGRAKKGTGTVLLRRYKCASRDCLCDHMRVVPMQIETSNVFTSFRVCFNILPSLDESS